MYICDAMKERKLLFVVVHEDVLCLRLVPDAEPLEDHLLETWKVVLQLKTSLLLRYGLLLSLVP